MKSVSFLILVVFLMMLFSSCAAPQSVQKGKTVAPPQEADVPQPVFDKKAADAEHVKNVVTTRQGALQSLYRRQNAISPMQGNLLIKLYISDLGMVQDADINLEEGALSNEFIDSVRKEVLTWRFMIREKMIYSFKTDFLKL